MAGGAYLRTFERASLLRGVPFGYAGGESWGQRDGSLSGFVCATIGGVKRACPHSSFELRKKQERSTTLSDLHPQSRTYRRASEDPP